MNCSRDCLNCQLPDCGAVSYNRPGRPRIYTDQERLDRHLAACRRYYYRNRDAVNEKARAQYDQKKSTARSDSFKAAQTKEST
ncbi:MAG TPA: hypothetical protein VN608_05610 [Clostridia bacterium]|nr:hypothetical protein [Clostridia bacterium]